MRSFAALLIVFLLAAVSPAFATETLAYGPAPAWVKASTPPAGKAGATGSVETLLFERQSFFGPEGEEVFVASAFKVLNTKGLQELGTLGTSWDPAIQAMTINKAVILRDGEEVDLLAGGDRFQTLRREANLNRAILDGALTAILEIHGLRVGDVVLFQNTVVTRDPVLKGKAEALEGLIHEGLAGKVRFRQVWPTGRDIRWTATKAYGEVKQTEAGGMVELLVDYSDIEAPASPAGAPRRYLVPARLEISEFRDWNEISALMAPYYKAATTLSAASPLKAEVEKIRAANATPEARALAAFKLVENEIRYLAVTMGAGGLIPAEAEATWSRRFGDCKAKTVLLVALLNELGIKAEPALVDSSGGDGLTSRLPGVGAFDHVIVRAEIGGKVYWLDGTRLGDRSLASISGTPFLWALPVRNGGSPLEKIDQRAPDRPLLEVATEVDATAGLDTDGKGMVRVLARGEIARAMEVAAANASREETAEGLEELWKDQVWWLKVDRTEFGWDEAADAFKVEFFGKGQLDWKRSGQARYTGVDGFVKPTFERREEGPDNRAPYVIDFPFYSTEITRVKLPRGGKGFELVGADVTLSEGGTAVTRKSRIANGEVVVESSLRTLAPEVPYETAIAAVKLFEASPISREVTIRTGRGGAATDVQAVSQDLLRLARQNIELGDSNEALTYLDQAIRRDPRNVQALELRSNVNLDLKRYDDAAADARTVSKLAPNPDNLTTEAVTLIEAGRHREALSRADEALKIDPDYYIAQFARVVSLASLGRAEDMIRGMDLILASDQPEMLDQTLDFVREEIKDRPSRQRDALIRGLAAAPQSPTARAALGVLLAKTEPDRALTQFDQALLIDPDFDLALRLRIDTEVDEKRYPQALSDADRLIALKPKDPGALLIRADLYNELKEPQKASADHDLAIRLAPKDPQILNAACWHRATANLELDRALADCSASISIDPAANTLDSRGLVNLRLGKLEDSIADYDRAIQRQPYAASYFGRGLAKRKSGDAAGADADIAKAKQLDPDVVRQFSEYGLTP